jgi:hypothetical protein
MHAQGTGPQTIRYNSALGEPVPYIVYIQEVLHTLHLSCVGLDRIPVM